MILDPFPDIHSKIPILKRSKFKWILASLRYVEISSMLTFPIPGQHQKKTILLNHNTIVQKQQLRYWIIITIRITIRTAIRQNKTFAQWNQTIPITQPISGLILTSSSQHTTQNIIKPVPCKFPFFGQDNFHQIERPQMIYPTHSSSTISGSLNIKPQIKKPHIIVSCGIYDKSEARSITNQIGVCLPSIRPPYLKKIFTWFSTQTMITSSITRIKEFQTPFQLLSGFKTK